MRSRSTAFVLGLLLGPVHAALPAAAGQIPVERADLLRAARAERAMSLRDLWVGADPVRRELALARLKPRAGRAPRAGAWPDLEALVDAERILRGGPGATEAGGWEQRLADSLTLVAVPGAFEARLEGRRQPITVYVLPLFETVVPEAVELRLVWTSPGGEERSARTEPVQPASFARGFEMYLSAPPSAPGEWSLVPVVLRAGQALRGLPVAVDSLAGLEQRLARLAQAELGAPARARVDDVLTLVEGGLRLPAMTGEDALLLAEGEPKGTLPGGLVSAEPHFEDGQLVAWRLGPPAASAGVLLVAGRGERPEELLAGALGERWSEAARAAGFELFATALPLLADAPQRSALDLLTYLCAERGWRTSVLVAFGEAVQVSGAALADRLPGAPDRLVLVRETPGMARPDARLDRPVLSIEPLAGAAGEEELRPAGPGWLRVLRREPRLLVELELPELVSASLAASARPEEDAARPAPPGRDGGR